MDGWIYEGINGWSTESIDSNIVDASMLIRQPGSALLISWGHGHRQRIFLQKKTVQNPRGCGNFNMLGKCTRSKAWQSFARKMQGFFPRYENHSDVIYFYVTHIYNIYIWYISSLLIFQVGWNLGWSSFEKSSLCGLDELWPVWLTVQAAKQWLHRPQSCGCLRYLRWEEVILYETICLFAYVMVLWLSCWWLNEVVSWAVARIPFKLFRLLWRLSECITPFGKFLGIPNVTLPAPDLKTLAM